MATTHVVKKDEVLITIARKYHVTVSDLMAANRLTDPTRLRIGQRLRIPDGKRAMTSQVKSVSETCHKCHWIRLKFNGKRLDVISLKTGKVLRGMNALSGLPAGHSKLYKLIKAGRTELDPKIDYRHPRYQSVRDVGPIPEAHYTLKLTRTMAFQRRGTGWGVGGWFLDPGWIKKTVYGWEWARDWNLIRGEFFLHDDGAGPGTGGCIGVARSSDVYWLQSFLRGVNGHGQWEVDVEVDYP